MPYLYDPTLKQPGKMRSCDVKMATLRVSRNGRLVSRLCLSIDDDQMVGFDASEVRNLVELMANWLDNLESDE
jgi:hypothetical protein